MFNFFRKEKVSELVKICQEKFPNLKIDFTGDENEELLKEKKDELLGFISQIIYCFGCENLCISAFNPTMLVVQFQELTLKDALTTLNKNVFKSSPLSSLTFKNLSLSFYWKGAVDISVHSVSISMTCPSFSIVPVLTSLGFLPFFKGITSAKSVVRHATIHVDIPSSLTRLTLEFKKLDIQEGSRKDVTFEGFSVLVGKGKEKKMTFDMLPLCSSVLGQHSVKMNSKEMNISIDNMVFGTSYSRLREFVPFIMQNLFDSIHRDDISVKIQCKVLQYAICFSESDLSEFWQLYTKQATNDIPINKLNMFKGTIQQFRIMNTKNMSYEATVEAFSLSESYKEGTAVKSLSVLDMSSNDSSPVFCLEGNSKAITIATKDLNLKLHNKNFQKLWDLQSMINLAILSYGDEPIEKDDDLGLTELSQEKKSVTWKIPSLNVELVFENDDTSVVKFSSNCLLLKGSEVEYKVQRNTSGEDYTLSVQNLDLKMRTEHEMYPILTMPYSNIKISRSPAELELGNPLYSMEVSGIGDVVMTPLSLQNCTQLVQKIFNSLEYTPTSNKSDFEVHFKLNSFRIKLHEIQAHKLSKKHDITLVFDNLNGSLNLKINPFSYVINLTTTSIRLDNDEDMILQTVSNLSQNYETSNMKVAFRSGVESSFSIVANLSCIHCNYIPTLPEDNLFSIWKSLLACYSTKQTFTINCKDVLIDYIPKFLKSRLLIYADGVNIKGESADSINRFVDFIQGRVMAHPAMQDSLATIMQNVTNVPLSDGICKFLHSVGFRTVAESSKLKLSYLHSPNETPKNKYDITTEEIILHLCFDSMQVFIPLLSHFLQQVDINKELYAAMIEKAKQDELKRIELEDQKKKEQEQQSTSILDYLTGFWNDGKTSQGFTLPNATIFSKIGASTTSVRELAPIPSIPQEDKLPETIIEFEKINIIANCYHGLHFANKQPTLYLVAELKNTDLLYKIFSEYNPIEFSMLLYLNNINVQDVTRNVTLLQVTSSESKEESDAYITLRYAKQKHHLIAKLLPMNLNFDYPAGLFISELFQSAIQSCSLLAATSPIKLENVVIDRTDLLITYHTSETMNISSLAKGNVSELVKFANLKNAPFFFSRVSLSDPAGQISLVKALQYIKESYTNDLCSSKLVTLAFGTLPFTAVRVFSTGAYNFVAIPVQEMGKQDGSIWQGLCKGFSSLSSNTVSAIADMAKLAIQVPSIILKNLVRLKNNAEQADNSQQYAVFVMGTDENTTTAATILTTVIGGLDKVDAELTHIANKFEKKTQSNENRDNLT